MPRRRPPSRAAYNTNVSMAGIMETRLREKVDLAVSIASETAATNDTGVADFFTGLEEETPIDVGEQYAEFEQGLFGGGGGPLSSAEQAQYNDFVEGLEG